MNNQENNTNINQSQVPVVDVNNKNITPIINIDSNNSVSSTPGVNLQSNNALSAEHAVNVQSNNALSADPGVNLQSNNALNTDPDTNNITISPTIISENPIQVSINSEQQSTSEISVTSSSTQLPSEQNNSNEKITEKDFIDEALEKQKNKNNIKSNSILFVFLILAVVSGLIYQLCFRYNTNEIFENNKNNTTPSNDDASNKDLVVLEDRTGIYTFSGTYTNENNDSIVEIFAINENKAKVSLTYAEATSVTYANLENNTLLEENNKTNNNYSIKIEKIDDQINLISSSGDENSILNKCSGTYDKKEYESKGWYGTYIFGSSIIYIDEYDTDSVIVNITNINKEHVINKVTDKSLEFESNENNINIKLKIEKSNNGIVVTASSSDAQSEYNKISGNYIRKN